MIITLKGCTASASIGGLNFYSVSKGTVGSGVSVNITTSTINKDAATSTSARDIATVALNSGYENLVVTVTMSGTTVSWYADGKVTIPANTAVTGAIKISASATAISTGGGEDPGVDLVDIQPLLSGYSTKQMSTSQQTALQTFIKQMQAVPTIANKIKNMYMPILCGDMSELGINVMDFIINNTVTKNTFTGDISSCVLLNNGIYTTLSLSQKYTSFSMPISAQLTAGSFSIINATSQSDEMSNGTRITAAKIFVARNYSAGNDSLQGTASGTTGTYCGVDLNNVYPTVVQGYSGQKNSSPCIDIMSFSDSAFRCTRSTDNVMTVEEFPVAESTTANFSTVLPQNIPFSYMIPSTTAYDSQCVGYIIAMGESLTSEEMTTIHGIFKSFISAYLA